MQGAKRIDTYYDTIYVLKEGAKSWIEASHSSQGILVH